MRRAPVLTWLAAVSAACSPTTLGINRMADALTATASAYSRDSDPEFVRVGAPSTLKMVEMLLDERPTHPGLLLTACSGFTQYAYAFLHVESDLVEPADAAAAKALRERARLMFERALGYCQRGLDLRFPKLREALAKDATAALAPATRADVPLVFWTAAARGGAAVTNPNPVAKLAGLAIVRPLLARALELDERWNSGAVHEALITIQGLPPLLGGSPDKARAHFDRAVELSEGQSATAYVAMASSVSLPAGNRAEFEKLLNAALAIDVNRRPDMRLPNLIAQRQARFLLSRAAVLFGESAR